MPTILELAQALVLPAYNGISRKTAEDLAEFNRLAELLREQLCQLPRPMEDPLLPRDLNLASMLATRWAIANNMAIELGQAVAAAEAAMSAAEAETLRKFESVGLTAAGMPAGPTFPDVAESQLRHLLMFQPDFRRAVAELHDARNQSQEAAGQVQRSLQAIAQLDLLIAPKQSDAVAGVA